MQFLIIAYDYDDAFERRMQSREQHIINTKKMMESGNIVSAGALIEDDKMVGSSLFVDFDTLIQIVYHIGRSRSSLHRTDDILHQIGGIGNNPLCFCLKREHGQSHRQA